MPLSANSRLAAASKSGNVKGVRGALHDGADIESRHDVYEDHGAYYCGLTPLMLACWSPQSSSEAVRVLLEAGADPHAVSDGGVTALWYASGGGDDWHEGKTYDDSSYADRLRLMLDAGCDPNTASDIGRSALTEAADQGSKERVKMLLDAGASQQPIKSRARMPLGARVFEAALTSFVADPTDGPYSSAIPLFLAAESGSVACVRLLLDAGADPKIRSSDGKTAVCFAKTPEVLNELLKAGTPLRSVRGFRDELDEAFEHGRYEVADALMQAAGGIEGWGDPGERLNRYVGVNMDPIAAKMLIDQGAPLDHRSGAGDTLLHTTCWQSDGSGDREDSVISQTLRLLLDAGLDPRAKNDLGWEPIHEAVEGDGPSATAVLVLVESGVDPDARTCQRETPLFLAAKRGSLECARVLLEHGADPTVKCGNKTPLSEAREYVARSEGWSKGGAWFAENLMRGSMWLLGKIHGMPKFGDSDYEIDFKQSFAEAHENAVELVRILERAVAEWKA